MTTEEAESIYEKLLQADAIMDLACQVLNDADQHDRERLNGSAIAALEATRGLVQQAYEAIGGDNKKPAGGAS